MKAKNKLLKAGTFYFIGNIFDKAVAFITIPIFTELLCKEDYGVVTTYLSWSGILAVIITLSLGNSIRTAVVDYADDKDGYMSSIFTLGTINAFVMTAVAGVFAIIADIDIIVVLLCCAHSFAYSIIVAVQWRYMMDLKYLQRTLLQCLPNLFIIIASIVLILILKEDKYMGRIYAYAIIMFAIGIGLLSYYFAKGRTFYKKEYWRYALSFSAPIIFHSLSTVILSQADRTMITWLKDAGETGIYGLAYQFGMVPLVLTTTFENIWIPWFTEKMESNDKTSINKRVVPYVNLVGIACVGIMLVAPEVLKFMTPDEYSSAIYMITPVIVATYLMFLATVSLDLEYYKKKTKMIAMNTVVAAIVNIILNFIFIPLYGGLAAAYTTVASYLVSFFMHYMVSRKLDKELFPFKIYVLPLILMSAFAVITTVFMDFALIRWGIGVVLGVVFCAMGYRFLKNKI